MQMAARCDQDRGHAHAHVHVHVHVHLHVHVGGVRLYVVHVHVHVHVHVTCVCARAACGLVCVLSLVRSRLSAFCGGFSERKYIKMAATCEPSPQRSFFYIRNVSQF